MKNILKISLLAIIISLFNFANFTYAEDVTPPTLDVIPPIITLLGDATVHIAQNATYVDFGATAIDDVDGDITSHLVIDNHVDSATVETYTETYTVSDTAGNTATPVMRTVIVDAPSGGGSTPPAPTSTFIIRDGGAVIYQGSVSLPDAGTVSIVDKSDATHNINSRSVLAVLDTIDKASSEFLISDLEYYDSFGSFYLKCITPQNTAEDCDNWQYAVGATTPATGIDTTILSGGETVGIYFGSQHRVRFDSTTITAGGSITATAESYNYVDNSWSALTGVTIGATQPNPNDPWNPTIVTSGAVDSNGSTTLTLANAGTYNLGIAEDYYFPSYIVTVNPITPPSSSGGCPCGGPSSVPTAFSVPNALAYLKKVQSSDGSFGGSDMYTDWVAVAYGATETSDNTLLSYLASHITTSSMLTDNERRAMAILALGQNPYSFSGTNYIDAITRSFDGAQFGDPSLVNDDIFALIPLTASGYTANDDVIIKDIQFILSKKQADGSWEGSVDLTSAAIQALSPFQSVDEVSTALSKASSYLATTQNSDGGWSNISSSSWAIQAMNSLRSSWVKNNKSSSDYLAEQQMTDGAVMPLNETLQNRIWATSYAIPAALDKPWSAILHSVSKPIIQSPINQTISNDQITETTKAPTNEIKYEIIPTEAKTPVLNITEPKIQLIEKLKQETIPTVSEIHMVQNTLVATAKNSEVHIPWFVIMGSVVLLGSLILLSFYKHFN